VLDFRFIGGDCLMALHTYVRLRNLEVFPGWRKSMTGVARQRELSRVALVAEWQWLLWP
jgi:hypothetical protein